MNFKQRMIKMFTSSLVFLAVFPSESVSFLRVSFECEQKQQKKRKRLVGSLLAIRKIEQKGSKD